MRATSERVGRGVSSVWWEARFRWSSVAEPQVSAGSLWNNAAMRFAMKTAPQHTTWPDMLAVWQAADEIELFESAWTFDHFYPIFSDSTGPCLEGWITTTALAQATNAGCGGRARDRHALPPPRGAREDGRDPRHHLGRPTRARDSAPAGTRRRRTPTASTSTRP